MLVLVAGAIGLPDVAQAQRRRQGIAFSGEVHFVSDYIFRGISRTNGQQTVQADLGLNLNFYGQLRFGLWGSGVAGATSEIREYIQYILPLPLVSLKFGTTRYRFPGAVNMSNTLGLQDEGVQTDEAQAGISFALSSLARVETTVYQSRRSNSDDSYTEIRAFFPFGLTLTYGNNESDTDEADVSIAYSVTLNRVVLAATYHEKRSGVRTSEIDDIWLSLRDGSYQQENVVFSISTRF